MTRMRHELKHSRDRLQSLNELYQLDPIAPGQANLSKWLRDSVSSVKQDPEVLRAVNKIVKDLKASWRRTDFEGKLADALAERAVLAVILRPVSTKLQKKIWAGQGGKSWKALQDFPDRLRAVANEVKRTNANPVFDPKGWIKDYEAEGRGIVFKRLFSGLPGVLNLYAHYIDLQSHRLHTLASRNRHVSPMVRRGSSDILSFSRDTLGLSFLVRAFTGHFHDREVCDLLTATAVVLGSKFQISEQSLLQARRRLRQRQT